MLLAFCFVCERIRLDTKRWIPSCNIQPSLSSFLPSFRPTFHPSFLPSLKLLSLSFLFLYFFLLILSEKKTCDLISLTFSFFPSFLPAFLHFLFLLPHLLLLLPTLTFVLSFLLTSFFLLSFTWPLLMSLLFYRLSGTESAAGRRQEAARTPQATDPAPQWLPAPPEGKPRHKTPPPPVTHAPTHTRTRILQAHHSHTSHT